MGSKVLRALLLVAAAAAAGGARADAEQIVVHVYGGYGTPDRVEVAGRVLYAEPRDPDGGEQGALENLVDNIAALESDEVEGSVVTVKLGERTREATTDDEGLFRVVFEKLDPSLPSGAHAVEVTAADPKAKLAPGASAGRVFVAGPEVAYGIVSDIDDTVVVSDVTRKLVLLANTFLKNAKSSVPVAGKARLYTLLATGGVPVFYVSGSPQNLHPRLEYYLALHGFPAGPIFLKNLGEDPLFDQTGYKAGKIEPLLERFPRMKFLCFGDDGEKDPEIYGELARRHPDRVRHVSIRIVTGAKPDDPRFAGMTAGRDSFAEARGLTRAGLLAEAQALEVAHAALGDRPLPEGFGLDDDLPPQPDPEVAGWQIESRDTWENFFRFLSQNWLGWLKAIGWVVVWALIGGSAGAVLGFAAGLVSFWKVRAWGWTRNGFPWYRWVGWMMPLWFAASFGLGGGWAGLHLGAGHQLERTILQERFVQRTLIQLAVAILASEEEHARLGDLTEKAARMEARSDERDRYLDRKVQERLDDWLGSRRGASWGEDWTLRLCGRLTLRALRDQRGFQVLRAAALLSDDELTRLLDEDPEKAVAAGHAALRPLLLKLDDALAGYVSGYVWSNVVLSLVVMLAAALAPVGLLRLADRWRSRKRSTPAPAGA